MKIVLLIIAFVALETAAIAQPSAEDLYTEGQTAYDQRDYATAIAKWQASYDLSKETALLFNLAQAKRLSGNCVGALAAYHHFVAADTDPTSEQHRLAEDLARELSRTCVENTSTSITSPTPPENPITRTPDRSRSGRAWKIAGLTTASAGIVTLAVGIGLGYRGAAIGDEITTECATNCDWEALKDKDARGRRYVAIGRMVDAAGVAAIAGGAIMYYLGMRQETVIVAPTPHDGGVVVSWSGSW